MVSLQSWSYVLAISSNSLPSKDRLAEDIAALVRADAPLVPLSGGRTNRVWRAGARVIKLYSGPATPLFGNSVEDEWRCLNHLSGTGLAPEPITRMDTAHGPLVIYAHVEGAGAVTQPNARSA